MMEVQIPIMDIKKCKESYASGKSVIDERVLCAGYPEGGRDSCGVLTFCLVHIKYVFLLIYGCP